MDSSLINHDFALYLLAIAVATVLGATLAGITNNVKQSRIQLPFDGVIAGWFVALILLAITIYYMVRRCPHMAFIMNIIFFIQLIFFVAFMFVYYRFGDAISAFYLAVTIFLVGLVTLLIVLDGGCLLVIPLLVYLVWVGYQAVAVGWCLSSH